MPRRTIRGGYFGCPVCRINDNGGSGAGTDRVTLVRALARCVVFKAPGPFAMTNGNKPGASRDPGMTYIGRQVRVVWDRFRNGYPVQQGRRERRRNMFGSRVLLLETCLALYGVYKYSSDQEQVTASG